METNFNRIKELELENLILKSEIQRLKNLLEDAGFDYSVKNSVHEITEEVSITECIVNENITIAQIDLFITLFHGRTDVYAKRFINKAGNVGYSPGCNNFWKQGVCPKRDSRKIKCAECPNRSWIKLNRPYQGTKQCWTGCCWKSDISSLESFNQIILWNYTRSLATM